MTPLRPDLRTRLARTIQQARRTAEAGARQSLESLAVHLSRPFDSSTQTERSLRNRLRSRARQLGDRHDRESGTQEISRLAHEVAYEHWHRMLFARFLAENGLLRDPEHGADLSLDDCRELARDEGLDPWEFAGRCAQEMLPRIFDRDDPVLDLKLPPETRQALEGHVECLPEAVCTASDSLGWTYQFWQAEWKDEVNRSGAKIGPDELPAVTQLFTERYMVLFLLHNTIGAWRAGKVLAGRRDLADDADGEEELRRAVALEPGGYRFEYLRFVRDAHERDADGERTGSWRPAAGTFPEWPGSASELRVLDPCCGSGHFLVEAFELLVHLRVAEEGISVEEAIRLVLRDNLFGLEIDPRCTQIAAFNLALAAWRMAGEPVELPRLNIACSGLAPNASEAEWIQVAERAEDSTGLAADPDLFGRDPSLATGPLRQAMAGLHKLFSRAPELGSLLDPGSLAGGDLFQADLGSLRKSLAAAIRHERGSGSRDERAVAAAGMARAAEILQGEYTLVVTNVPFLARGKQGAALRKFAETHHGDAKGDIATVFVSRIFGWLGGSGTMAVVSPQNWLFLKTYRKLRERLLKGRTWNVVARLGPGAFETIGGHVVNVELGVLSAGRPDTGAEMAGVDASTSSGRHPSRAAEKAKLLRGRADVVMSKQGEQVNNPDAVVLMRPIGDRVLLSGFAAAHQGISTSDNSWYRRKFWELASLAGTGWEPLQSTVTRTVDFAGREHVLNFDELLRWDDGHEDLQSKGVYLRGERMWGEQGISVSQIGPLPVTRYTGDLFDTNNSPIGPLSPDLLPAVWCFCSSPEYAASVREIDQKLNVTNATLVKVPFDFDHWKKVADERYPNGLPEPYSHDPTQWIFHGDPCGSVIWDGSAKTTAHAPPRIDGTVLQIAVARLLGYRWPAELDPDMRLAPEQRIVADDCRAFDEFADNDGIVCLAVARGEASAADRLRALLAAAYGDPWSAATERALLDATTTKGRPPKSLELWLRDRFFREHCQLFHNRPFIWHVWDGRPDGFHALVNYHRLAGPDGVGRRTLESLTFAYLGEWIDRQRTEQSEGEPGADARLAAALDLQHQLQRILTGEPPCDIFVRWRPPHGQAIGWEPRINDGVRLNIRPFMRATLRKGGRTGAGILRWKPNITWKKDRGKEPEEPRPREDFPWFWGCPGDGPIDGRTDFKAEADAEFDGNRWNDLHYTASCKNVARDRIRSQPETL